MRFKVSENDHVKKHEKHEHTIECQSKENDRLKGIAFKIFINK